MWLSQWKTSTNGNTWALSEQQSPDYNVLLLLKGKQACVIQVFKHQIADQCRLSNLNFGDSQLLWHDHAKLRTLRQVMTHLTKNSLIPNLIFLNPYPEAVYFHYCALWIARSPDCFATLHEKHRLLKYLNIKFKKCWQTPEM